jgi:hypothetical protein
MTLPIIEQTLDSGIVDYSWSETYNLVENTSAKDDHGPGRLGH